MQLLSPKTQAVLGAKKNDLGKGDDLTGCDCQAKTIRSEAALHDHGVLLVSPRAPCGGHLPTAVGDQVKNRDLAILSVGKRYHRRCAVAGADACIDATLDVGRKAIAYDNCFFLFKTYVLFLKTATRYLSNFYSVSQCEVSLLLSFQRKKRKKPINN